MSWYTWVVLLHVLGAFGFVFGHGASAMVSFRLRAERSPERVASLLGVSSAGLMVTYVSLLLLIVAGVIAAFMESWWGSAWLWAAIIVLVVMLAGMYAMATPYYKQVRLAAGVPAPRAKGPPPEPVAADELARLLDSSRPMTLAWFGGVGLVIIIWLMVVKPF
ncbi:MAG TPA: DUF2269 family protein [Candidatus Limnocylindria bacterium]|nr:DUF2269 family protein [Candidatus Limnocylindria bacterium]